MSKITDNLILNDFGDGSFRGKKTIEAALIIGNKKNLSKEEMNIFIEAGYFRENGKFKSADDIIDSRLTEIFSVMAFVAESSVKWKKINEDQKAKELFVDNYRKGMAGLIQRSIFE